MESVTKTITLTAGQMNALLTAVQTQIVKNNEMLFKTDSESLKVFLKERIELAEEAYRELVKP